MKRIRIGLLPRILIAILLGVLLGNVLTLPWVRLFITFNSIFSQFLGFMIPLIIVGLVAPAIADIGSKVGRLLLWTVGLAYVDTILAGLLGYGVGSWLFPQMVEAGQNTTLTTQAEALLPFFEIKIPPLFDVMAALVLSFVAGLSIAYCHAPTLKQGLCEMRKLVEIVIQAAIIPLLPLYIFGIFLEMTFTGSAYHILLVFAKIIVVIFVLHITVLLYEFVIAGGLTHRNPLKLLWTMLPAYFMALGTSSSAATIPVTLRQTKKNGVSEDVASFAVPLCATIHMSGSMMKITCCALTVCLMSGLPYDFPLFLHFMMLLGVCMVAGPGVPGGAIMAALGPLASILGFSPDQQALMIALYIAMDSFGTACNVTGDGAIALILDKLFRK
ncbi:MAG: dicarboxylate/amino acid:cation symporter [Prevotella sp.]|nr:dicarboxylate/amino acid:cation symporter [Prevotella sp.]